MKILIDNGHGSNTAGKRSPDGRLMEYAYTREIAERVVHELRKRGLDAERIVREEIDVPLAERCKRVNEYKASEAILVSIHCDRQKPTNWRPACIMLQNEQVSRSERTRPTVTLIRKDICTYSSTPSARQYSLKTSFRTTKRMWTTCFPRKERRLLSNCMSMGYANT